ncbi:hypothetical protein HJA89_27805 [Rhizobium bangladeshense]|uniref:phosphofurin acidic cluster sorting protein n=1 Tax=Rhizobium TaxID=379 RepID=UPI001C82DE0A|nr:MULTISPECIES: phosphofurin acidic cluster sorting protein [Rhizobium]MBX4876646.1 hypothetical protein [Rhizobium bangladeshense]MBX4887574.1 hypothetical protein [Rhizobium bangladeshense]MBX5146369.1 hypothetical protein [Rhizobium lentis]
MNDKIEVRLSSLFTNPAVKAAFERAERDNGAALVVPAPRPTRFIGGAGASLQWRRRLEALELA